MTYDLTKIYSCHCNNHKLGGTLLHSFSSRPLPFWLSLCIHNNTWNRNIGKKLKWWRPWSIHHVNDVRWTQDGHRGRGAQLPKWRTGPSVRVLYRVFRLQTLALLKLLVLTGKKLAFKFSMYIFKYWSLPTYINCTSTHVMNAPRPSLFFAGIRVLL